MLLDLGVGDAGEGDNVVFVAKVCNTPTNARRLLLDGSQDDEDEMGDVDYTEDDEEENDEELDNERELALALKGSSFVYIGGGPCRGCPGDNRDHRRNLQTAYDSECVPLPSGKMSCKITASEEICDDSGCSTVQSFCRAHVLTLDSMADVCECQFDFWDFLIDLNEKIKTYTVDGVVPNHGHCCGTTPQITITTKEVSENRVNYGC